jgi:hypothetical protein
MERRGKVRGVDELLRLLDDARADERSAARQQERTLRQVAEEGAWLAGTLVDLAEQASAITVRTTTGRSHHGVIRLVATDFCVLGAAAGDVWLAVEAVATIRPHPEERHAAATGNRAVIDLLLVEALARVAPERPRVAMVLVGGEAIAGELRAVGTDVVTLRLDGDPQGVCYVSAASIREVFRSG